MRMSGAGWVTTAASVMLLAACAEAPLAPEREPRASASFNDCFGGLQTNTRGADKPTVGVSLNPGQTLGGVLITATYAGGQFGLPFSLVQRMNYGPGTNFGLVNCLGDADGSYSVTAGVEPDPIPVPAGVDADWWTSLSPREQAALVKWAQNLMTLYPGTYHSVGQVIASRFQPVVPTVKIAAKIRAMDYYGGSLQGQLLAGGIYGCMLYRRYQYDAFSPIANRDLLDFVSGMVAAFGEAEFASTPLTGLRFGRNGIAGAVLAAADPVSDCGFLTFQAVNRTISVGDPYLEVPGGSHNPDLDR